MDGGPRRVFDVGPARGLQDFSLDKVVECGLEVLQWLWLVAFVTHRMVSGREGGVEETRLCAGEVEVCPADCLQPQSRARRCMRARADLAHPVGHAPSELPDRLVADRREQRIAVGEVPVGGVGNDTDHARHLSQHDGVRPAEPREVDTGRDERSAHRPAWARSLPPDPIAPMRVTHVTKDSSGQCPQNGI
jgi:hypothetical protein